MFTKKCEKVCEKRLTFCDRFSILTKRSRERVKNWKVTSSEAEGFRKVAEKKCLTSSAECAKLNKLLPRGKPRNAANCVPCKLNNVKTNLKHQI